MARPTKYRKEFAEQAEKLCLLGMTDAELSHFFECDEKTLNAWKKRHPEFLQSIKKGKANSDANVAQSLYRRATGMSLEEVRMHGGGEDDEDQKPSETKVVKEIAPDPTAAIFWLKNRQPDKWRDKKELDGNIRLSHENALQELE